MEKIGIDGSVVHVLVQNRLIYLSLNDIMNCNNSGSGIIIDWLNDKDTLHFLGIWESKDNPDFDVSEYRSILNNVDNDATDLTIENWIGKVHPLGIIFYPDDSKDTIVYLHKEIAFKFAERFSPQFRFKLIKAVVRLESELYKKNILDKSTNRVSEIPPPPKLTGPQLNRAYESEEDILNTALFGMTEKEWQKQNPHLIGSIRDHADYSQHICLSNLKSKNEKIIAERLPVSERLKILNEMAVDQMDILTSKDRTRQIKGVID